MNDEITNTKSQRIWVGIAGGLFLVQMTAAVFSHSIILGPLLRGENFLANVHANESSVTIALLLDLLTGAAVFGISVIFFPILKKYSESGALWYVGLRLNEWIALTVAGVFLLTVVSISEDYAQAGAADQPGLAMLAKYFVKARGMAKMLMLVGFCLSASVLYYILFISRLVPRFISIWGMIGVLLLFAEMLSNLFGQSLGGIKIMIPLGLNEIFLGVWLMVKGFNPKAII